MDKPNYVLKTNEAVLMPKEQSNSYIFIKKGVLIIVAILILGSLIFQENLFFELSWTARVILIVLAVVFLFFGEKKIDVPSPIELQFYDEYLILYRPKRYYSKKVTRMEFNKMLYTDITRCIYKANSQRLHIYGNVAATWYNYDANGVVPSTPTYNRMVTDTLCYMSTRCAPDVDFKSEIESHSPIQVLVENS